jgi:hypothetical protein
LDALHPFEAEATVYSRGELSLVFGSLEHRVAMEPSFLSRHVTFIKINLCIHLGNADIVQRAQLRRSTKFFLEFIRRMHLLS